MSCATATEDAVLQAFVAGTLSKVTVPVGIEVGSVAIEAFGVTGMCHAFVTDSPFVKDRGWIVMDGVPTGLVGMTGIVSGERTIYFFILALQNIADQVIGPPVRTGKVQNHTFYGASSVSSPRSRHLPA